MLSIYSINQIKTKRTSMNVLDKTAYTCTMIKKLEMLNRLSGKLYFNKQSSELSQEEMQMNDNALNNILFQAETAPDFTCRICTKKKKTWFNEFGRINKNITDARATANHLTNSLLGALILGINTQLIHLLDTILKDLLSGCIQFSQHTPQQIQNIKTRINKMRTDAQQQAQEDALGRFVDNTIDNIVRNLLPGRQNEEFEERLEAEGMKLQKEEDVEAEGEPELKKEEDNYASSMQQEQNINRKKNKKDQKQDKIRRKEYQTKRPGSD